MVYTHFNCMIIYTPQTQSMLMTHPPYLDLQMLVEGTHTTFIPYFGLQLGLLMDMFSISLFMSNHVHELLLTNRIFH